MAVFRGQGEMEVEVHLSDDPTEDVQTKTPEETPKSGLRLVRMVLVSFGLQCVLQATLNISLRLVYFNVNHQLEIISYNNLTHERDQLKTSNKNLTRERDQLQTSNEDLTRERDQLQTSKEELTREREQLETSNKNLTRERDQLQTTLNTLMKERDDHQKRPCETGWTRFGCSCYYVSNMITSWGASRRDCQQRGADLVVINTIEEQKFLFTFGKTVWMGLSDSAVEGTWTWVDGTPLTTAYWRSGQPDNSKDRSEEGQDCAAISSRFPDPVTRWYDTLCGEPLYWVCERGI